MNDESYRMGDSLENLSEQRHVCRLLASHRCQSCEGYGRLYQMKKRNGRPIFVKMICRDCTGAVKVRDY